MQLVFSRQIVRFGGLFTNYFLEWDCFVKKFQWGAVLYVKNITIHAYRQHTWRDAGGRGFAIPSGDLGGDSSFLLVIWHVYVVTRSGDLALTWRRCRLVCKRDMLKIWFFKKEIRLRREYVEKWQFFWKLFF